MIERLERKCPDCNGTGNAKDPAFACPRCWISGKILTEEGKALIEFIRDHASEINAGRTPRT